MHSFWSKCGPNYGKSFNFILISLTFMFQVYVSFIHHRFNRFLLMVKVGNVFDTRIARSTHVLYMSRWAFRNTR